MRTLIVAMWIGGAARIAQAGQATCSNPGLPVGAAASADLAPGQLIVGARTALLPISSTEVLAEPTSQLRYDNHLTFLEARGNVEYAITTWLAATATVPYRIVDEKVAYFDPATGAQVRPADGSIHARTETLHGVGDPDVGVHVAREAAGIHFHVRAGTSLPLGGTLAEDPFVLGTIGQEHEHIQFGTGTFVPFVAVEAQRPFPNTRATLAAWAVAHLSLYANDAAYRAGSRVSGGLDVALPLGSRALMLTLGGEVHAETAERWNGIVHETEGNAGRQDVYAAGAIAWHPTPDLAIVANFGVPVYEHVAGNQLAYSFVAGLGAVATFDLARKPAWRGLDARPAGEPGSAPALAPVADKLAIYAFHAAWCPPCRALDRALAELVAAHPERYAVRELDVVDTDSAAWRTFLAPGGFDLPHVKVVAPDGTVVLERSAPPAQLVRAIEDLPVSHSGR